MSRSVSLTTLISDVRFLADAGGATVRHTDAQITRRINQAIQAFRRRISDEGSQHYLVSHSGTLGIGPTSPYPFYQLDLSGLSPALVRTYGVDVTFEGGHVRTLSHVPFEARAKYGTSQEGGTPEAWAHFKTDQVAILPASSSAYAFTVWYLPVFTDLSAGGDTFDGVTGWEDYIVADVVCQLISRDQQPGAYQIALDQRNATWENIVRDANKVTQAGGAHVGRDSFGSKLPHFLGGSRPRQAVAGGPYVPAPGSVTDAMLADMTGPTVKGVLSGTTRPYSVGIATLTTYLSQFSTLQRGLVPAPLSIGSRYLDDSGNWTVPAGGGGGGSVGPSGAVQYQAGTGMAGASGFRIHGLSGPSLIAHLDGTFRITGGQLQVGSGTVRVTASGVDVGGGSVINVATLVASALAAPAFTDTVAGLAPASAGGTSNYLRADGVWGAPSGAHQFPPAAGATNAQLAVMASGTVKANLSGNAVPSDVAVATLHAFSPTFTATQPGTVPESGGGTTNFLRADGSWAAPPGGSASPSGASLSVQFNNGGSFGGTTGIAVSPSGDGFRFGPNAAGTGMIAVRHGGRVMHGRTSANDGDVALLSWGALPAGAGALTIGASGLATISYQAGGDNLGGHDWWVTNSSRMTLSVPAGFSRARLAVQGPITADAIAVTSGIGNQYLDPIGSGMIKGRLSGTGAVTDVPFATFMAFAPTFTSARAGVVPNSDGAATSYLAGNGTWTAPSGAHQFPPVAGATNAQLAVMPTGTVKGNLSGNATPSDVSIATLFAFSPTFTATQRGVVPASGGGTTNYLRADGTWDSPPGGSASPGGAIGNLQYNNGVGGFNGASGVSIVASGQALAFGVPSFLPGAGDLRVASGFNVTANLPSGISGVAARQNLLDWSGGGASGVLKVGGASGVMGTVRTEVATGGAFEWLIGGQTGMALRPTGIDASQFHIRAKSIDVEHINGLPATANNLKRGTNIPATSSGVPSGLFLYAPRGAASGANRYIVASGTMQASGMIFLRPSGAKGGEVIRIERVDTFAAPLAVCTPTGTVLHAMPSGTKSWADFMYTKPSGPNFELAGHADMH